MNNLSDDQKNIRKNVLFLLNEVKEFILSLKDLLISKKFSEIFNRDNLDNIIQWILDNIKDIYNIDGIYYIKSEYDYDISLKKPYTIDELVDTLYRLDYIKKEFFSPVKQTDINIIKNIIIFLCENNLLTKSIDDFNILDISNIRKSNIEEAGWEVVGKKKIKSLIDFNIMLTHTKSNINGYLTDIVAGNEEFMYELMKQHNLLHKNLINKDKNLFNKKTFYLKGGNVFKLNKRYLLEKNIERINYIDNQKEYKDDILNDIKKDLDKIGEYKKDNLSDWDFGVNIKVDPEDKEGIVKIRNKLHQSEIFNDNDRNFCMYDYCEKFKSKFEKIWENLKFELNERRKVLNVDDINIDVIRNLEDALTGMEGIDVKVSEKKLNDIIVKYEIDEQKRTEKKPGWSESIKLHKIEDKQPDLIEEQRSKELYLERNPENFKEKYKTFHVKPEFDTKFSPRKNINIVDIEILGLKKIFGKETVFGFDLVRMRLLYNIEFTILNITIPIVSNAELYDYACGKPLTIIDIIEKDPDCDYKEIEYSYNHDFQKVKSWSLGTFAEDIFQTFEITKLPDQQDKKYQKRLLRLMETIRMMKLHEYIDKLDNNLSDIKCPILTTWLQKPIIWEQKLNNGEYISQKLKTIKDDKTLSHKRGEKPTIQYSLEKEEIGEIIKIIENALSSKPVKSIFSYIWNTDEPDKPDEKFSDTQVKIIKAVFAGNIEYYGKIIINNIFIILVTICMIIIIFYIVKNKYFQLTISMRKLNASEKTPVLIEE